MGCFGCLKVVLVIFSVCYLLVGLGLLAVALWLHFDYLKDAAAALSGQSQPDYMNIALYIAMGIGGFLALLGILGCVGALRISLCLLGNFAVLLVAAIGGLIAVCVLAYIYQDSITNGTTTILQRIMTNYGNDVFSTNSVDAVQRTFKCCGSQGPTDWVTMFGKSVPASCCVDTVNCVFRQNVFPQPSTFTINTIPQAMNTAFGGTNPLPVAGAGGPSITPVDILSNAAQIFMQGCGEKLRKNYRQAMQIIVGLAGGIAGFMLLGFVMCIAFCCVM